jgi:hypothetical protein
MGGGGGLVVDLEVKGLVLEEAMRWSGSKPWWSVGGVMSGEGGARTSFGTRWSLYGQ